MQLSHICFLRERRFFFSPFESCGELNCWGRDGSIGQVASIITSSYTGYHGHQTVHLRRGYRTNSKSIQSVRITYITQGHRLVNGETKMQTKAVRLQTPSLSIQTTLQLTIVFFPPSSHKI